ncbi:DUF4386 domain-containing protein [Stenotrophomonas indicatrix]|uniref:DUF4386 domain-containing protein n=1 Tax=Stenotrophomonas indicatrix TaxID=2045451 RepID=UPI00341E11C0
MATERAISRGAGAVYLLVVVTGIFSLGYVPGQLRVAGDPQAMLGNLVAHQQLFQWGVAAFLIEQVAFLLLPLILFRLLQHVHRATAVAMVALAVTAVPIALVAASHRLDALAVLTDTRFSALVAPEVRNAMALQSLQSWSNGVHIASLFWGLWLLPFGWLVFKSGVLPKVFGVLLMLGCLGYAANVFGELLVPGYAVMAFSNYATAPASLGEIGICLWLLVVGVRARVRATI